MKYSDFKIADEGIGIDILKAAGKAALDTCKSIAKIIAVIIGLSVGITSISLYSAKKNGDKFRKRLTNLTDGEKQSQKEYLESWVPAFKKWAVQCERDFKAWKSKNDPANDIDWIGKVFMGLTNTDLSMPSRSGGMPAQIATPMYGVSLCEFDYYSNSDMYEHNRDEYIKSIKAMKPLIQKWQSSAAKFAPYFECEVEYGTGSDENDPSFEEYPYIYISLSCKFVDDFGILKEGLPKFK